MDEDDKVTDVYEAILIAQALRVAIPLGRELGWTSDRTYREAESKVDDPGG